MTETTIPANPASHANESGSLADQSKKFGDQSKKIVADVRELGGIAKDTASQAVDDLRERGSEALHSGRDRAVEAKGSFEHYVIEQPLKSVAIAIGAGLLLGLFVRR